jgi:uncharacterized membrane protein
MSPVVPIVGGIVLILVIIVVVVIIVICAKKCRKPRTQGKCNECRRAYNVIVAANYTAATSSPPADMAQMIAPRE